MDNSFVLKKEEIDAMLASEAIAGKTMLDPLAQIAAKRELPFNIIQLNNHTNKVEVHRYLNDLWYCLEGQVKFFVGGTMIESHTRVTPDGTLDETELRAKGLEGAKELIIKSGDWLWIPAMLPHQHITQGTARLMIIKIPHLTGTA